MSKAVQFVQDMIEKVGWAVIGTEREKGGQYTYTIGLQQFCNSPEVIITGIDMNVAHSLLHGVVKNIVSGVVYNTDDIFTGILGDDRPVKFNAVSKENRINLMCQAYYHNDMNDFRAIQMIWPDSNNKFPGDVGFNKKFKFQFLLS